MGNQMDTATARAILGGQVAIRKSGPATFAPRRAAADLARVTKVATFSDLSRVTELGDWLPDAADMLAQVLGGVLLADEVGTDEERMRLAINAVDGFRDELLTRLAGGIKKRYSTSSSEARVAKSDAGWTRGIL